VKGEQEFVAACQEHQFEVAVIGQGVPKNEKHRVLRLVKQHCPEAKVLELVADGAGRVLSGPNDFQMRRMSQCRLPGGQCLGIRRYSGPRPSLGQVEERIAQRCASHAV